MNDNNGIVQELKERFGENELTEQSTRDGIPTLWALGDQAHDVLQYLKAGANKPYRTLYDLTAIDERIRSNREGQPASDFTVVYHVLSYERNGDIRIKVPLKGEFPSIRTVTDIWPAANWYEREMWDMFGINVEGHPHLSRILMPSYWQGYPLRKEHPARATEMGPYMLPEVRVAEEERMLQFRPEDWGLERHGEDEDFMFLNIGPQHPGTHGVFRIIVQLDGEQIVNAIPDIGYHHRAQEKMAERQNWHTFIPYTDRVEYLSGVLNNFSYCQSVETLAGIDVPERAKVIRIMMAELFRISSHLVWYGTYAQDLGALSPVFYMFTDRERLFGIVEAITGARMHPSWFRIGGIAQDLPKGWEKLVSDFVNYLPRRLNEYDKIVMQNPIFRGRTVGVGGYTLDEAIEWGVTGPNLRACGMEWDWRKNRPYGGYDQFEFEIPVGSTGDCYDRAVVHVEEMRQSLRIIEQCMKNMPAGPYKSDHPLTTPPLKEYTMHDIETLITHFLNVSWGPVIPSGEVSSGIESSKGNYSYYLVSDGGVGSYRTHIRTPSFPHLQTIPLLSHGLMIPDLIAILGSLDFVMSDVDR
jgi:NADH-quinone oxidoreductase subunit C/D